MTPISFSSHQNNKRSIQFGENPSDAAPPITLSRLGNKKASTRVPPSVTNEVTLLDLPEARKQKQEALKREQEELKRQQEKLEQEQKTLKEQTALIPLKDRQHDFLENLVGTVQGKPLTGRNLLKLMHELALSEGKRDYIELALDSVVITATLGTCLFSKWFKGVLSAALQKGLKPAQLEEFFSAITLKETPFSQGSPPINTSHPILQVMKELNLIDWVLLDNHLNRVILTKDALKAIA